MSFGKAEQCQVILSISSGTLVDQRYIDWAVEEGYAAIDDNNHATVTEEGWKFMQG
ncbi:MAG: hypothetical protein GAK31_01682 [Stenotrophomonas maltophilia]|uniref:Uncharacterized protein n=1 Tax=Stenotrophomonas maltophilia TaxID=40324 RepID=A0A7V8FI56_STEMA|nr:MAG: hypothetical protein GAK31_01682 [Stenotrophomonas maltophilia]